MTSGSHPLVPTSVDLRDFAFMPIEITRLFGSRFNAAASDAAWRAGVTLWLKSWHQVPAASLPDDDVELSRLADLGRDLKTWKKVRPGALHGWVKCSDGRLYHPVVAEKALEAWLEKLDQRSRSGEGNLQRWGTTFNKEGIQAEIDEAVGLLEALNSNSRVLLKRRPKRNRTDPTGNPTGTHKPSNKESLKQSHSDPAAIPEGMPQGMPEGIPRRSQGTGKGQGEIDNSPGLAITPRGQATPGLKAKLRELVGQEPVKLDLDFGPIERLLSSGDITEADVIEGVSVALRRSSKRIGDWSGYENWIINAAKDRLRRIPRSAPPDAAEPIQPYRRQRVTNMGGGMDTVPDDRLTDAIERWQHGERWIYPTPPPGEAGCRVPADLLPEKYRTALSATQ